MIANVRQEREDIEFGMGRSMAEEDAQVEDDSPAAII
jgi:hypothetical protein